MPDTRTDEEKAKDCETQYNVLSQIRLPYEPMIDNILTFVNHSRRLIVEKDSQRGQKTGDQVYDGTALQALNLLADGLAGYSISRSFRWFEYTLPGKFNFPRTSGMRAWSGKSMDEYPDVKNWLEACEAVMYAAFLRSNLYDIAPAIVREAASVGTVSVMVEEDESLARIVFTLPHFRECYIAENRFGMVDTIYRVYKYTLRQLVDKFGWDKMVVVMQGLTEDKYKKTMHEEHEIIHAVYPRSDYDPQKSNGKNKPYASLWVLRSPLKLLGESGYDEKPSVTWRWFKNNDEWYGRSPAWDAFVDVVLGNQQARTNLKASHKMAEPPMIGPSDLRGLVHAGPNGWTWIDGPVVKDRMPMPLYQGIQLPYAVEQQDRTDKKIREHFAVDFFLMLSQAAMNKVPLTATQVLEMAGEKAAVLGPRIGHMESECFNPIHDRMFAIERNAGRIPEPPDILMQYAGSNLEIDYLGPLSQAQKKLFKSQGIRAGLESMSLLTAIKPEAADVIDADETARILLESTGFPAKALRDEKQVAEIRKIRQEQMAIQETLAGMDEAAKAAQRVTKAPEEGSLLKEMMGNA